MGGVIRFERPVASSAVIASLVALGYLQQAKRHRASAIERAIGRLRGDLHRAGVLQSRDVSLIAAQNTPPRDEAVSVVPESSKTELSG